jgi:pyruvate formate lyase activating enzyme
MTTGQILHIQRLSTEDGPGIRTTVFFKGCPLRCDWCHNPESLASSTQTQWFKVRCLGCKTCVSACPHGNLTMTADGLVIDRERCQACGKCAEVCPAGAIELLGKTITSTELMTELLKDRAYYEKSGGGVTLSGGEPTFQPDFTESLLRTLKEAGISTALDTCGLASWHTFKRLLPFTDLVLFDLKLIDLSCHRQFTGQSNEHILENLLHIRDFIQAQDRRIALWVRTPLIPGATDTEENLQGIGRYLASHLDGLVSRWELCAFNNLCRDQYVRLGLEWKYARTPLMTSQDLVGCVSAARSSGFPPDLVIATGATRAMEPN